MEKDDLLNDDFLRTLVGKSSIESPSADFTDTVMSRIRTLPETASAKKSFLFYLKSSAGYILLAAMLVGFFVTSDLPVMSWIPGKNYWFGTFTSFFDSLLDSLKSIPGKSGSYSIPVMIILASGLFFVVDKFLTNRNAIRNHPAV
jgi:hypothetical protein